MGGIIVTNAVARGDLLGLVDGAVSVCGCFDSARIVNYAHSRHVWQPLLTHGLKAAFVAPEGECVRPKNQLKTNPTHTLLYAV
jgi:hypothetical protein